MPPTFADVKAAHWAGAAAGRSTPVDTRNPYAGEPLKPWDLARMSAAERRQAEREQRDRHILATTWQTARRRALDQRHRQHQESKQD